ncbi:hypothetical protein QQS21_003124 [Conoideocrella luteorostrata]|uniref:Terpene synthase n=1 Tax=Conoideocrella luteorostrata TaxID=1105319 RepID=A0AAJ0CTS5_9HYPO|nr:hypothetical protein QQS21_003124 [Conoideocrella luteorostrata]
MTTPNEAEKLYEELKTQSLHLPDLRLKFQDWPQGDNVRLDDIRVEADKMIRSVTEDKEMLDNAERSDMGHLASLWYPKAGWTELQVGAAYLAWVFIWDDEIDLGMSETAKSSELGREYCDKSLDYINKSMGLNYDWRNSKAEDIPHPYRYMRIFEKFGFGLRAADEDQRWQAYKGLRDYIAQVGVEHSRQLNGHFPTSKEYLAMRRGTAGVAPVAGCTEFMNGVKLPAWLRHSREMEVLAREATMMCLIINDLYSAHKEVASKTLQNYVVVLYAECEPRSLGQSVKALLDLLDESKTAFNKAVESLEKQVERDAELGKNLRACIDTHRHFVTGLIEWTLTSARYKMDKYLQKDGSFIIPLVPGKATNGRGESAPITM